MPSCATPSTPRQPSSPRRCRWRSRRSALRSASAAPSSVSQRMCRRSARCFSRMSVRWSQPVDDRGILAQETGRFQTSRHGRRHFRIVGNRAAAGSALDRPTLWAQPFRQTNVAAEALGGGEEDVPDLAAALRDLVAANHILAHEGIVDAYGHISMRHHERPDRFFLAAGCSPETVTLDDIREYDLECKPVLADGHTMYVERPIHGAIFQR